jgi:hypothetical protein
MVAPLVLQAGNGVFQWAAGGGPAGLVEDHLFLEITTNRIERYYHCGKTFTTGLGRRI